MQRPDSRPIPRFSKIVAFLALVAAGMPVAAQTTFTVTSTDDTGDIYPGDDLCQDINASCTLRAAIEEANANSASDIEIDFSLGDAPPFTIDVNSSLRIERDNVTIDGTTQSTAPDPEIELDGNDGDYSAFVIEGDSNEIRGLSIFNFEEGGIVIDGNRNSIVENLIGADTQGNAPGGAGTGVLLLYQSSLNFIGKPGEGNIIVDFFRGIHVGATDDPPFGDTGDADGNTIQDNIIGALSTSGPVAGNTQHGIMIQDSDGNIVGGDRTQFESNMIVDNGGRGIYAFGSDETRILGNLVGISPGGDPMGNDGAGIEIADASLSHIGEAPTDETGNIVADNGGEGILIAEISGPAGTGNTIAANEIDAIDISGGPLIIEGNGGASISDYGTKTVIGGNPSGDGNTIHVNPIELHGTDAYLARNSFTTIEDDCIRITGSQNTV
ncbi:MAG: hypothetical protein ACOCSR_00855, partial [Wenzhouxiangella sp.]